MARTWRHRLVDALLGTRTVLDSLDDAGGDGLGVVRVQQQVHAGPDERSGLRARAVVGVLHRAHKEAVGDGGALEAHLFPQQALQDLFGAGGGRFVVIEGGVGHVRAHHQIGLLLEGGAERGEVRFRQFLARGFDEGHLGVRIGGGAAVAGEVLGRGQHSLGPAAAQIGSHQASHALRLFPEGARGDDGVLGGEVHVRHRGEGDVDAAGASFAGGHFGGFLNELLGLLVRTRADGAEGHRVGKLRSPARLLPDAALDVGPHQQRVGAGALSAGEALAGVGPVAIEEDEPPDGATPQ
jgi:hypothetical protein